jgi:hypothetical protein
MGWASRVLTILQQGVLAKGGVFGVFIKAGRIPLQIEHPENIELFFLRLEQLWLVTLSGVEWLFLHCSLSVISSVFLLSRRLKILMKDNMSIIHV